jgi:3-isopropylmalate/(R)-2-methylmalate dehydratase large subunit
VAAIWATGCIWLRVPESIKITLTGQLGEWVSAKDLALYIVGRLGADAGAYASVEFHGPAVTALSMESRFVLPNMMAEMGAKNAWIAPDEVTMNWLAGRIPNLPGLPASPPPWACAAGAGRLRRAGRGTGQSPASSFLPDPDASYIAEFAFDASTVEPQIACPHTVDNVVPISQVAGTRVDQAFLGTCTNGRLEDIAEAAHVLAGKRVARGTRLLVIPASSEVLGDAMRLGYLETLLAAGAAIGPPGCGPCMGNHLGVPAPGEVTISTANRNFRGRMGTPDAEIYLASPAVVAASAAAGEIVHPASL